MRQPLTARPCGFPAASILAPRAASASFRDAWEVPLRQPEAEVVSLFAAIFGHRPRWMQRVMLARNRVAALAGLEVPSDAEITRPTFHASYQVGQKIGAWPIHHLSPTELVAGRDNTHLDFRVSVLKQLRDGEARLVISTLCHKHNGFGAVYLRLVAPFHRLGMRLLLNRAAAAGRL